jgi:hypothetical protein
VTGEDIVAFKNGIDRPPDHPVVWDAGHYTKNRFLTPVRSEADDTKTGSNSLSSVRLLNNQRIRVHCAFELGERIDVLLPRAKEIQKVHSRIPACLADA